ncbi:MAG: IPT/TIG domain-containing protein, partial [Myxococcales bacterium]|nr:IPT/TIG domain-containing protein [Myxococcales bacterium]
MLQGTGFVTYAGAPPAVTLAGEAMEVVGFDDCVDVPVRNVAVQSCAALTVRIPQGGLPVPDGEDALVAAIALQNPAPVECGATNPGALVIAPPPSIAGIAPQMICDAGETTFDVLGDRFLTVDGAPPVVTLDGVAVDPGAIAPQDCVDLPVERLAVQSCDRLTVTLDPATIEDGQFAVAVANPQPAGCGAAFDQAVPVVPPPTVESVEPSLVCTADGERTLVVRGAGFMQVGDALPTVRVGDAELTATAAADCVENTVGALMWSTCTELTVPAPQGALTAGQPPVTVINPAPAGCASTTEGLLTVPPSPVLTQIEPRSVCSEAGDRALRITGEGFLEINGQGPTLRMGGQPFAIEALEGCAPVSNGVRACTSIAVTLPRGALPEGGVLVEVQNPGEAQCNATSAELFDIVPVPVIDSIEPQAICERSGDVFVIHGRNFTDVSQVFVGDLQAVEVEFIDDTALSVTLDDAIDPGLYDVRVSNADGCEMTAEAALRVAPRPVVFFVDPPVVYNGISIQATVYTTGLEAPPGEVRFEGPNGEINVLPGTPRPDRPNQIRVTLPAGLAAGLWDVQVTSDLGCVGRLEDGLTVTEDLRIGLTGVTPQYVSPDVPTAVVVGAAPGNGDVGFVATPRAYLTPNPPDPGVLATALRAVVYVDEDRLTAVVPGGLEPADYDVIVVNPDATVGVAERALTVVTGTPPVIDRVIPASLDGNGLQLATLTGRGFDVGGVEVLLVCRDPLGNPVTGRGQVQGAVAEDAVDVMLPGDAAPAGSVCLVRLTNGDGAFFEYSAVSIKTPAQNLNEWQRATPMVEARRAPGLVAGRPTETSRFLFAAGGDNGAVASARDTVEAAQVGLFGDLGDWSTQRNPLPAPRTQVGMVRIGRFVYLVGGHDGQGAVTSVLRAQILDPLAGPEVIDLGLFLDEEVPGVGPGVWHYRVSAVFPANDPVNPGGEG